MAINVAEESKLLSLGWGHKCMRLDTRVPGSLWHAARLETSWPGQWLRYLAAVVSICEYMISNKAGLLCHCHDCVPPMPYIMWGQLLPLPFPPVPPPMVPAGKGGCI